MKFTDLPHRWALPVVLACLASLLQALDRTAVLRLEPSLLLHEPWRLATGQLLHLGWTHLLLNVVALALLWSMLGQVMSAGAWLACLLVSAAGVALGLLWFSPEVQWYVGLSGLMHGMLAAGAVAGARKQPAWAAVLLGMLLLKLVTEQLAPNAGITSQLVGGVVVVDAHLYGAVAGLAAGFGVLFRSAHAVFR